MLRFGSLILISIVFTKTGLSTAEIGHYEIFMLISGLLSAFWVTGLIQSFLPLFEKNKTFSRNNPGKSPELFNAFLVLTAFSILTLMILLVLKRPIESIFNQSSEIKYFDLLLVYIFLNSPSFLTEYIYLLKNKPVSMLIYGFSSFLIQFLLVSSAAVLGLGMFYCITGLVIVTTMRYIWLVFLLKKYARPAFSPVFIGEHLRFGYPLIVSSLLGSSAQYIDGFMVMSNYDPATFAIFQYGAREFPLVLLMANAFSTAMIPEFSEAGNLNNALARLKQKTGRLMHFLFPCTLVLMVFSDWLYPIVFNENFMESAGIFNIYLLLIISRLVFPHTILIGLKKTGAVMWASVIELTVNLSFSFVFMLLWGIKGVALGTLVAYGVQKSVWIIYVAGRLKIRPAKYIPVRMLSVYSVILLIVFLLTL